MILIDNRQNIVEVTKELERNIENAVKLTLEEELMNIPEEVSVILVDNNEIRELNKEFRNIDRATDVLSFPMLEYSDNEVYKDIYLDYTFDPIDLDEGRLVLGDIVISLEKALEQSDEYGHSFMREVCYLTTHSTLHLLGYDHMEEEQKIRMRSREEYILNKMDLSR
jgi:probable rRNA maturation factor